MGNTKSALQLESHRRFPFEPHRGCSHPARTPATRTDCQGRKHTLFDRTPEKTQKGKVSKSEMCQGEGPANSMQVPRHPLQLFREPQRTKR